jgi:hypothetical protein
MLCPLKPDMVVNYFKELDQAIDKLSHKKEGSVARLPGWVLVPREIKVCLTTDGQGVAIKVTPNASLESDEIYWLEVSCLEELNNHLAPYAYGGRHLSDLKQGGFAQIHGFLITQGDHPLAMPAFEERGMLAFGKSEEAADFFTTERAKFDAIELWNQTEILGGDNFVYQARQVFDRFRGIVKRKSFLERRIHRYLYEHARILLPSHKRCFFGHLVWLGQEKREIDFILEREAGLPPILIELESPVHRVCRKDGELTRETNHAKSQIAEWVSFIDKNPATNASGDFSFLSGPKQRLVIIGKGLEHRDKLIESKYTDTTIWTYDLLLEEARSRWNNEIANQYEIVGLPKKHPF